jgi:hypothetical protein
VGFTAGEVERVFAQAEIPLTALMRKDLKSYYNGYRFSAEGREILYNSDMVLYFTDNYKRHGKYPMRIIDDNVKTDYGRLRALAESVSAKGNKERLLTLIKEEGCESDIVPRFSFEMMYDEQYFVSLLFYMGLLTIQGMNGALYILKIPNYVIKSVYGDYLFNVLRLETGFHKNFNALQSIVQKMATHGNADDFIRLLRRGILPLFSNRDLVEFDEKYIKAVILTILGITGIFIPVSEREVEKGYIDIFLQKDSRYNFDYEWIIELKYLKVGDKDKEKPQQSRLEKARREAVAQLSKYNTPANLADTIEAITGSREPFFKGNRVKKLYLLFVGKQELEAGLVD